MSAIGLRRYTDLPALIYLLRKRAITLLDPRLWDDQNDRAFLELYALRHGYSRVLVLCFCEAHETYHHWRVFANGPSGVCIEFDREALLNAVKKCSSVMIGAAQYRTIRALRDQPPTIEQLPYLKRIVFKPEHELRMLHPEVKDEPATRDIPIPLDVIKRINLSPWLAQSLVNQVREHLMGIDGCSELKISRSTLVGNDEWRSIGARLGMRGSESAE